MSVRNTSVCTNGECGGECYRCRLAKCSAEKELALASLVSLVRFIEENPRKLAGLSGPFLFASDLVKSEKDRI